MEPSAKRLRDNEDNEMLANQWLSLGKDLWPLIMSKLSVRDIIHMRRTSPVFYEFSNSSAVWNTMFIREFGQKTFHRMKSRMPKPMERFLAWRFLTAFTKLGFTWQFKNNNNMVTIELILWEGTKRIKQLKIETPIPDTTYWIANSLEPHIEKYFELDTENEEPPNTFSIESEYTKNILTVYNPYGDLVKAVLADLVYTLFTKGFYPAYFDEKKELLKNEICAYCAQPAEELRCSACKSAFYCNAACQENDWARHKKKCLK